MNVQPQNSKLNPSMSNSGGNNPGILQRTVFFLATAFILFWQLGHRSLWQSEDRWAEIARNMLLTHDYFHPIMNATVYFDKPLVSYWFITITAGIIGQLNEWAIRAPSAIMGALALYSTFVLAKKHWSERTAWLAIWILLTSFGFIFWSRTAAADMANATASILTITWFYHYKEQPTFRNYFIFYLICIIGAQTKGLGAIAVPILAVVPYLLRGQHWKQHMNLAHIAAGLVCAGLYFLPFFCATETALPAGYSYPEQALSGLALVYRENIQRFIHPFDHTGTILTYVTGLPYIMLPWAPLLVAALFMRLKNFKSLSSDTRWLLEAILLIFCFFSLSGSRRWYYILPLAPMCAILIADYWQEGGLNKVKRLALGLIELGWLLIAVAFTISPLLWKFAEKKEIEVPSELKLVTAIIGILCLLIWAIKKFKPELLTQLTANEKPIAGVILLTLTIWSGWFAFQNEILDSFRTERPFALELKARLKPADELVFYKNPVPKIVFYLNSPKPYRVISKPNELVEAINGHAILLVAEQKNYPEIAEALHVDALPEPVLQESISSWEKKHKKLDKKLVVLPLGKSPP